MPASRLWYINLYLPLLDIGHEVVPFEYDLIPHYQHADLLNQNHLAFIEQNRPKLEQTLLKQVQEVHEKQPIDLFFSYFYSAFCRPEVIRQIRQMGIITANWYCNGSYQFHLVKDIAPAYDYCLVPEKFRLQDYRQIGATPIYFQEAANPTFYKPYDLPYTYDVTFVGQKYGERPEYIRYLLDQDINVKVWGWGWQNSNVHQKASSLSDKIKRMLTPGAWRKIGHRLGNYFINRPTTTDDVNSLSIPDNVVGPPLSDEEMVKMYSRSKISLGFSTVGNTHQLPQPIKQVRLRDFEAPMSGAFYMVEFMQELEEFFDIGTEIACYTDKHDLAEKIKYYLNHDKEREEIRLAGYRRAQNEHSWQQRFQQLFSSLGLPQ